MKFLERIIKRRVCQYHGKGDLPCECLAMPIHLSDSQVPHCFGCSVPHTPVIVCVKPHFISASVGLVLRYISCGIRLPFKTYIFEQSPALRYILFNSLQLQF